MLFFSFPVISLRVRFEHELTASKILTYEFVLLQKKKDYWTVLPIYVQSNRVCILLFSQSAERRRFALEMALLDHKILI